jgi:hypothetical protein
MRQLQVLAQAAGEEQNRRLREGRDMGDGFG